MTREEAITRLKNMAWLYGSSEREQNIEAIDMAIEALSSYDELYKKAKEVNDMANEILDDFPSYKEALSTEPQNDDLIIKGAKGIKDGLYNIKDGELFQYKAKGGTVRTYKISSAEPSTVDYRTDESANIGSEVNDLISRADAIEAVRKCKVQDIRFGNVTSNMMLVQQGEVIVALSALPSADRPQGEWIEQTTDEMICSVCDAHWDYCDNDCARFNYCPNCGAYMGGGDSK